MKRLLARTALIWLVSATIAGVSFAGSTPFLDREFPKAPDLTSVSDTGPGRTGLELDPANLIPNGDFEEWGERRVQVNPGLPGEKGLWETWFLPNAWTYRHWGGTGMTRDVLKEKTHRHSVVTTFESTDAHRGKRALDLAYAGLWFCTDLFRIEPGRKYVLSLWIKGRNIGRGVWQKPFPLKVYLRMFRDPKREHLAGVRAFQRVVKAAHDVRTFDWKQLRWEFTAPLDMAWATLHLNALQARGGFLLLVDDVSLHKVLREPHAWSFDRKAGFGNTRRDNVAVVDNGLELARIRSLVANGGFETDANKDGLPDGWRVQKSLPGEKGTGTFSPPKADPKGASQKRSLSPFPEDTSLSAGLDMLRHTGQGALKLSASAGNVSVASPLIQLDAPGYYTLSVYCKSSPRTGYYPRGYGSVTVRSPMDGTTYSRNIMQYAQGWFRETITFPHPGRARPAIPPYRRDPGFEIILGFHGNGAVWFDDVQLEPARRPSRLASAGAVYADQGEAVSEIIDMGYAQKAIISWDADVPEKRLLHVRTRTGFTPYYDRATWTDWSQPYAEPKGSPLELQATGVPLYVQWQACFLRDDPKIVTPEILERNYVKVADVKEWRYSFDPEKKGLEQGFATPEYDDKAWKTTTGLKGTALPDPPEGFKDGVVWYRTRLALPKTAGKGRLYLGLVPKGGLSYPTLTTLYVNGVKARTRQGAHRTWVAFGHLARPGRENSLVLQIAGPGSDRFDYLARAQVLLENTAVDLALKTTPLLRSVRITVEGPRNRWPRQGDVEITHLRNGEIRPPLMPFRARTPEEYDKAEQHALRLPASRGQGSPHNVLHPPLADHDRPRHGRRLCRPARDHRRHGAVPLLGRQRRRVLVEQAWQMGDDQHFFRQLLHARRRAPVVRGPDECVVRGSLARDRVPRGRRHHERVPLLRGARGGPIRLDRDPAAHPRQLARVDQQRVRHRQSRARPRRHPDPA